jgi:hypothetical protein
MAPEGHGGDLLSQISTPAGIEALLALHPDADYRVSLKGVWEEVTDVTALYCIFVTEAIATSLSKFVPGVSVEDITIPDAPEADADPLRLLFIPRAIWRKCGRWQIVRLRRRLIYICPTRREPPPSENNRHFHRRPGQRRGRPTSFSCGR